MAEWHFTGKKKVTEELIEARFLRLGLHQTMKGTLKSLPPNIHWHLKKPGNKGVCEVTLLLQTREVTVNCKANRRGEWIEEAALNLQRSLSLYTGVR